MDVSYIDSHAHIYLDQFRGNIDNIIKNSLNNNLQLKHLFINMDKYFHKKTLTIENQINVLHRVRSEQET